MGCDIHPAIEYRETEAHPWIAVMFPNRYFGEWEGEPEMSASLYVSRDYDLFAMLGNVRNGTGFAGCDTGDGFAFMSDCRGVPDDISDAARAALSNEHSATWVTLAEILAFDWDRTTKHRGTVNPGVFAKWDHERSYNPYTVPDSWSGSVSGNDVQYISNQEMRKRIEESPALKNDGEIFCKSGYYTIIEWESSYSEDGKQMWTRILPKMLKLGAKYGHSNVRLVMDFDS